MQTEKCLDIVAAAVVAAVESLWLWLVAIERVSLVVLRRAFVQPSDTAKRRMATSLHQTTLPCRDAIVD